MIKLTKGEIIDGQNEAYLKAGHNAYFGNGFNAGVDFALKQVNKLPIHIVSKRFKTELEMHEIATEKYHEHNYGDAKYDGFMECYRMLVKAEKLIDK